MHSVPEGRHIGRNCLDITINVQVPEGRHIKTYASLWDSNILKSFIHSFLPIYRPSGTFFKCVR